MESNKRCQRKSRSSPALPRIVVTQADQDCDLSVSDSFNPDSMFGALRSPPDDSDMVFEKLTQSQYLSLVQLPETLDLRDWMMPIRDQGKRGTCSAFTGACVKEYWNNKNEPVDKLQRRFSFPVERRNEIPRQVWLSPDFIYIHRGNNGPGMYGRDVFDVLKRIGTVPEFMFPYSEVDENMSIPTKKLYSIASNYKISQFARVDTPEGLKRALFEVGPCYVGFPLYNYGLTFWKPAYEGEQCKGGHAVAAVGYTREGFIIRNSWGPDWGDGGYGIYPYGDWGSQWECWVSSDVTPEIRLKTGTIRNKNKARRSKSGPCTVS